MLRAGKMLAPQGFQENWVCGFPDNGRIVEHVSAIGFGGLICLCPINIIILCL